MKVSFFFFNAVYNEILFLIPSVILSWSISGQFYWCLFSQDGNTVASFFFFLVLSHCICVSFNLYCNLVQCSRAKITVMQLNHIAVVNLTQPYPSLCFPASYSGPCCEAAALTSPTWTYPRTPSLTGGCSWINSCCCLFFVHFPLTQPNSSGGIPVMRRWEERASVILYFLL